MPAHTLSAACHSPLKAYDILCIHTASKMRGSLLGVALTETDQARRLKTYGRAARC
ncbi:uncharacterized protein LAESUDRAFT_520530 [Laetiporus sulphureus 93-53]|uniref:Uncharacterized protein n=1 Tax=Laetiporus sulphureus 93-53 TaxID=1314785 RepID=A0A165G3H5_9APHY|nr:uncharacterized protein LAESUDRAFT_520530 [Laetiporus sulphureus 93-53]KZT09778.1 hypothetical protein LAESUDRAFT_520530 [Laetiporus sulphureus 93-53]